MKRRSRKNKFDLIHHYIETRRDPPGFKIDWIDDTKGRGVVAVKKIQKGDFLFEYRGEIKYKEPKNLTYAFEFTHNKKKIWKDASKEDSSLGRLVNDSVNPNATCKLYDINGPKLLFFAIRDIDIGTEITFNYDGTKQNTFEWRGKEKGNMSETEISSEIHSSGSEWHPESDDDSWREEEEETSSVTTSQFKAERIGEWVENQQSFGGPVSNARVKQISNETDICSSLNPSSERPTKRSVVPKRKRSSTDEPVMKIHPKKFQEPISNTRIRRGDLCDESDLESSVNAITERGRPTKRLSLPVSKRTRSSSEEPTKKRQKNQSNPVDQPEQKSSVIPIIWRGRPTKRLSLPISKRTRSSSKDSTKKRKKIQPNPVDQPEQKSKPQKKSVCYVCGKSLKNIKRHLKEVHKIIEEKKFAVSAEGYRVHYCPRDGKIIERLRDHLKRSHHIQDENLLTALQDCAERVTMEDYQAHLNLKPAKIIVKRSILEDNPDESDGIGISQTQSLPDKKTTVPEKKSIPEDNLDDSDGIGTSQTQSLPDKKTMISEENEILEEDPGEREEIHISSIEIPCDAGRTMKKKNEKIKHETYKDEKTLLHFKEWLTSKRCRKQEREAKQHCAQVFSVWNTVKSGDTRKLHDILDADKIDKLWYAQQRNAAPGTIKSYISSCCLFIDYLIVNGASENLQRKCIACKTFLKSLSKGLNKEANKRKVEVQAEDIQTMISPNDISNFLLSDQCEEARQILQQLDMSTKEFRSWHFTLARDFILFNILLQNGQRPGAVLGITHKIFRNALLSPDGATFMVTDHKTGHIAPANIAVDIPVYNLIKKYLLLCRMVPGHCPNQEDSIFITWPLPGCVPGQLTKLHGVQHLWERVINKKLTATKLRKAVSTNVRELRPELREDLAAHMNHLPTTADRYYILKKSRDKALGMSKIISDIMNPTVRRTIRWEINVEEHTYQEFSVNWPRDNDEQSSVCPYLPGEIKSPSVAQSSMTPLVEVFDDFNPDDNEQSSVWPYSPGEIKSPSIAQSSMTPLVEVFDDFNPDDNEQSSVWPYLPGEIKSPSVAQSSMTPLVEVFDDFNPDDNKVDIESDVEPIYLATPLATFNPDPFQQEQEDCDNLVSTREEVVEMEVLSDQVKFDHLYCLSPPVSDDYRRPSSPVQNLSVSRSRESVATDPKQVDFCSGDYRWPSTVQNVCVSPSQESVVTTVTTDSQQVEFCSGNLYLQHRRRSFLKDESEQLIFLCEPLIRVGNIKAQAIIETLKSSAAGLALLDVFRCRFGKELNTKLRERLKTEIRKRAKQLKSPP